MASQISIKAWGNSQGILLPKKLMNELKWNVKDVLEMEIIGDEIRIRKPFKHRTLEERIAAYDGKIEVCDFDWGDPTGEEML